MKTKPIVSLIFVVLGIILMVHFISLGVNADYWLRRGGFMLGFIILIIGGAIVWPWTRK